jgi:predicted nucleic acid-binding protein
MIVVDSNILAARNLTGVQTPLAERVESIDCLWVVPPLWRYEFQNILVKGLWSRQLTTVEALQVWRTVMTRMADNERDPSPERVIDLASHYRITAYDANFIALALEMDVLCVTEDAELQQKFPAIAVGMEPFIQRGTPDGEVRESRAVYRPHKRGTAKRRRTPCT